MKKSIIPKTLLIISIICTALFVFFACDENKSGETTEKSFNITAESTDYGIIKVAASANAGETVKYTIKPKSGYYVYASYLNGEKLYGNEFIMPDTDVCVTAEYAAEDGFDIITDNNEYGVVLPNPLSAKAGDKVTLKTYVSYGKTVDFYTVNGEKITGKEFIMPEKSAKVSVTLKDLFSDKDIILSAKQSGITAKSHWQAFYGEKSLTVTALIEDSVVFTDGKTQRVAGYLDNTEFIIGRKSYNETSFNRYNYRFLVTADGKYFSYVASNGIWHDFGGTVSVKTSLTDILTDGFAGYKVTVDIPYFSIGLTRNTALDELTFACSLRNTVNALMTNWNYYSGNGVEWDNPKSHLVITENGFVKNTLPEKTEVLLIGGGVAASGISGGQAKNLSALGKTTSIAKADSDIKYWTDNIDLINAYSPEKVLMALDGDLSSGVLNSFNNAKTFIDEFTSKYKNTELTILSALPVKSVSFDNEALKAYNSSVKAYADSKNIKFIDAFADLYDGIPYSPAYSEATGLSSDGYSYLNRKILSAFGKYAESSGVWGDYGIFTETDGVKETSSEVTFYKAGVQETYLKENAGENFVFSVSFTVKSNITGDEWPKFGLSVKNRNESVYLYVDGSADLTSTNVGTVRKVNGDFDWSTSKESSASAFKYTDGVYVTLTVKKVGNELTLFLNGNEALKREFDFNGGDCTVGIFGFSLELTCKNRSLERISEGA